MIDLKHIHIGIIDNPDFNLTVAAKRDLRVLCNEIEHLTAEIGELRRRCEAYEELLGERVAKLKRNELTKDCDHTGSQTNYRDGTVECDKCGTDKSNG